VFDRGTGSTLSKPAGTPARSPSTLEKKKKEEEEEEEREIRRK
jgi:hypothetical protein